MFSKKQIILTILILSTIVIGGSIYSYLRGFHTVTISLADTVDEAYIEHLEEGEEYTPVESIDKTSDITLRGGDYRVVPTGDQIVTDAIEFTVPASTSLSIDPDYTPSYLTSQADQEISSVRTAINEAYPEVITGYTINNYQLLKKGQWMGVVITPKNFEAQNNPVGVHRVLLSKKDGVWTPVGLPWPVLTTTTHPDTPVTILTLVNDISFVED